MLNLTTILLASILKIREEQNEEEIMDTLLEWHNELVRMYGECSVEVFALEEAVERINKGFVGFED